MRDMLYHYFGEASENALIIHEDGKDWVSSRSLCDLMGVADEYYLIYDKMTWPEMNLTRDEKRQFEIEGAHVPSPYFVSEAGFWKIVARSNCLWARKFRASFLPTNRNTRNMRG